MQYELINRSHTLRREVEQFICERYWVSFKACLQNLPEMLLVVFEDNAIVAACGIQLAEQRPLFSEYYLTDPVESYQVAQKAMPTRDKIAEVGSMAAVSAVYLPLLFSAIVGALIELRRDVAVFTATRYLNVKLARSGVKLTILAQAHESALPTDLQSIWGDYYQHEPMVFAGWVAQGKFLQAPLEAKPVTPSLTLLESIAC